MKLLKCYQTTSWFSVKLLWSNVNCEKRYTDMIWLDIETGIIRGTELSDTYPFSEKGYRKRCKSILSDTTCVCVCVCVCVRACVRACAFVSGTLIGVPLPWLIIVWRPWAPSNTRQTNANNKRHNPPGQNKCVCERYICDFTGSFSKPPLQITIWHSLWFKSQ